MPGNIDLNTFIEKDVQNYETCLAIANENKIELDTFNNENSIISINSTMRDLERIGRLINLADVGSQGFHVNVQIQVRNLF